MNPKVIRTIKIAACTHEPTNDGKRHPGPGGTTEISRWQARNAGAATG
jgi:hypothetical protein